jgi:hypothetical protein
MLTIIASAEPTTTIPTTHTHNGVLGGEAVAGARSDPASTSPAVPG